MGLFDEFYKDFKTGMDDLFSQIKKDFKDLIDSIDGQPEVVGHGGLHIMRKPILTSTDGVVVLIGADPIRYSKNYLSNDLTFCPNDMDLRTFIKIEVSDAQYIKIVNEDNEVLAKGCRVESSIIQRMPILGRAKAYGFKAQLDGTLLIVVGNH